MRNPYQHTTVHSSLIVGDKEFPLHSLSEHALALLIDEYKDLRHIQFEFVMGGYDLQKRYELIMEAPALTVRRVTGEATLDYHLIKPMKQEPDDGVSVPSLVPMRFDHGHSVCFISQRTHQVWGTWQLESVSA